MSSIAIHRYHTERIDGIDREKPLPERVHILIQKCIAALLEQQASDNGQQVLPELGVRMPDGDYLVPDIVVTRSDAEFEENGEGMLVSASHAVLCIEIQSPKQSKDDLEDKCRRLLASGCPACWLLLDGRTAVEMMPDGTVEKQVALNANRLSIALQDVWTSPNVIEESKTSL